MTNDDHTEPDHRSLAARTDEELYAHARRAFARGDRGGMRAAYDLLHFRHQRRVRGRLALKLPAAAVEDATQDVFLALFDAVRGGKDVQKVTGWLNQVAANTIADFHRGKEGRAHKAGLEGVALDDVSDDAPARELPSDGGYDAVDSQFLVDALLDRLADLHRAIVERFVFEGRGAKDVAAATGASEANVYQVAKRFRDELRAALSGDGYDDTTQDRT